MITCSLQAYEGILKEREAEAKLGRAREAREKADRVRKKTFYSFRNIKLIENIRREQIEQQKRKLLLTLNQKATKKELWTV